MKDELYNNNFILRSFPNDGKRQLGPICSLNSLGSRTYPADFLRFGGQENGSAAKVVILVLFLNVLCLLVWIVIQNRAAKMDQPPLRKEKQPTTMSGPQGDKQTTAIIQSDKIKAEATLDKQQENVESGAAGGNQSYISHKQKPNSDRTEIEIIKKMVESWRSAWEEKKIEPYIGFYHPDFIGKGKDRKAWRAYKNRLNKKYRDISIKLLNTKFQVDGDTARVFFNQSYQADTYRDNDYKMLELKKEGNIWKIFREHSFNTRPSDWPKPSSRENTG